MAYNIYDIVARASMDGASDIHLVCGLPPMYRIDGDILPMASEPLSHIDCEAYAVMLAKDEYEGMKKIGQLDMACDFDGQRVRINLFRQQNHVSATIRLLSNNIPALEDLNLPPAISTFPAIQRGIVLITGETGSGKSTTLAALIDRINHTRKDHIITLEDPIEYVYTPDICVINQREIGKDTASYSDGLRAILREDPDVILVGEMRDLSTITAALTAAETGHLVFATLHTNSAVDSIDRIVDVFPEGQQHQIRLQLSMSLQAVVSQQLLKKASGKGRVCACEVMIVNAAIRNLIREAKTPQIANVLATSAKDGSITMDNALVGLVRQRQISSATAVEAAHDPEYVKKATLF